MTVLPAYGLLDTVPAPVLQEALWWEQHILEVLTGVRPDEQDRRPQFDPQQRSLAEREAAKAAELAAAGRKVTARSVRDRRHRYQTDGLLGLVDRRAMRPSSASGRVDAQVVTAMRTAIAEAQDTSTRTAGFVLWRTRQLLQVTAEGWVGPMPSQRTLYRLFARLSLGRQTTGTARARRSLAARPETAFSQVGVTAPGEVMQIDSTPLDVMVLLDEGVTARVELTALVDIASRSITAAVLRPSTKAVDAAVLLARSVTAEPMRPGWSDALRMAASVLPHQRLVDIDARLQHAAARPVIVPETIVCDHGKAFISHTFRASCRFLGINLQPARKATPTDKPHIERTIFSVGTLFAQYLAGYVGRGVEHRGRDVSEGRLWKLREVQDLLDEWIVCRFTDRGSSNFGSDLRLHVVYMSATTVRHCVLSLVWVFQMQARFLPDWVRPADHEVDQPRLESAGSSDGRCLLEGFSARMRHGMLSRWPPMRSRSCCLWTRRARCFCSTATTTWPPHRVSGACRVAGSRPAKRLRRPLAASCWRRRVWQRVSCTHCGVVRVPMRRASRTT